MFLRHHLYPKASINERTLYTVSHMNKLFAHIYYIYENSYLKPLNKKDIYKWNQSSSKVYIHTYYYSHNKIPCNIPKNFGNDRNFWRLTLNWRGEGFLISLASLTRNSVFFLSLFPSISTGLSKSPGKQTIQLFFY